MQITSRYITYCLVLVTHLNATTILVAQQTPSLMLHVTMVVPHLHHHLDFHHDIHLSIMKRFG